MRSFRDIDTDGHARRPTTVKVKREIGKGCLYLLADQRQKLVKMFHITDISSLGHSKMERKVSREV